MSNEEHHEHFSHRIEGSAIVTVIGILILFASAVIVTLMAPRFVDPSWTQPTSYYQVQMYEVSDPNFYISTESKESRTLQYIYHLKNGFTLLAFKDQPLVRIVAPRDLEKYVTRLKDKQLKLTSRLLLLRKPVNGTFKAVDAAAKLRQQLDADFAKEHPHVAKTDYTILELYDPGRPEAFALALTDGVFENFVDRDFTLVEGAKQSWHQDPGVIYVSNPQEYRYLKYKTTLSEGWRYDPEGSAIKNLEELNHLNLGFRSRKELIALGEHIYAIEGCWYCHTDQTRTLVQDTVLNGSDSYPAPPSSPNEYIYQAVTYPGTRRIGPDMSRVGIKRPSRDWHKSHFWAPRTESKGSLMPSFRHFFDDDPRGTSANQAGIPNYKFEAIFQYLMTKGTRITPPTQAWWLGRDPVNTLQIIEGRAKVVR